MKLLDKFLRERKTRNGPHTPCSGNIKLVNLKYLSVSVGFNQFGESGSPPTDVFASRLLGLFQHWPIGNNCGKVSVPELWTKILIICLISIPSEEMTFFE